MSKSQERRIALQISKEFEDKHRLEQKGLGMNKFEGFDLYQEAAHTTAIYPMDQAAYPFLKLAGEAGEIAEKFGKLMRDKQVRTFEDVSKEDEKEILKECQDVLWYISEIYTRFGVPFSNAPRDNLAKLQSRKERGVIKGSGDNR